MLSKLNSTLRGWVGRYGSEAAFVGRVALAALLPPGCDRLLSHGLEAAFEYLQDKSEGISDHDLAERLDRIGVPQDQLDEAVSRIDREGQVALDRVYQARQMGISEEDLVSQLRDLIACDPTLKALQTSMSEIADQLHRVEAQGELLIAGQHYQLAAIEEMMQMMRVIATQVGLPTGEMQKIPTPLGLPKPSSSAFSSLGASLAPSFSSGDALSRLGSSVTPSAVPSDALSLLGSSMMSSPASTDALSSLGSSVMPSSLHHEIPPALTSTLGAQNVSLLSSLNTPLAPQTSVNSRDRSHGDAQDLVERFMAQQRARAEPSHIDRVQAVALVERFKDQMAARRADREVDNPQVGRGRVSLTLVEIGPTPIAVVKWLCEEWSYSLQDAIITTQSTPCVVRRSDHFVMLGQARNALERLGAQIKLVI